MTEVTPRYPATVTLPLGHTLTVAGGANAVGFVRRENGTIAFWIAAWEEADVGPYSDTRTFKIEATVGTLNYEIAGPIVPTLEAILPRATEIVRSQRIITEAIYKGQKMSLHEKLKLLAERSTNVPKAIEAKADALFVRLDKLEASTALDGLGNVVATAEQGVAAAESALAQITNGAPLPND